MDSTTAEGEAVRSSGAVVALLSIFRTAPVDRTMADGEDAFRSSGAVVALAKIFGKPAVDRTIDEGAVWSAIAGVVPLAAVLTDGAVPEGIWTENAVPLENNFGIETAVPVAKICALVAFNLRTGLLPVARGTAPVEKENVALPECQAAPDGRDAPDGRAAPDGQTPAVELT